MGCQSKYRLYVIMYITIIIKMTVNFAEKEMLINHSNAQEINLGLEQKQMSENLGSVYIAENLKIDSTF